MSKIEAKRTNLFRINPYDLTIIGGLKLKPWTDDRGNVHNLAGPNDTNDGADHALYDERIFLPIDPSMVANIEELGVLSPVTAVTDGDAAQVDDGRRRVIHARIAYDNLVRRGEEGLLVPVQFTRGTGVDLFAKARALNAFRTNDGALQNARNAQRMLDMGATYEKVANSFGVSDEAIRKWVALLKLSAEALEALEAGEITPTAAAEIASLPKEEQHKVILEIRAHVQATGKKESAADTANRVRAKKGKSDALTPRDRIKKASAILGKVATAAPSELTKEGLMTFLEKLSKAVTSMGLSKLADSLELAEDDDEE